MRQLTLKLKIINKFEFQKVPKSKKKHYFFGTEKNVYNLFQLGRINFVTALILWVFPAIKSTIIIDGFPDLFAGRGRTSVLFLLFRECDFFEPKSEINGFGTPFWFLARRRRFFWYFTFTNRMFLVFL